LASGLFAVVLMDDDRHAGQADGTLLTGSLGCERDE